MRAGKRALVNTKQLPPKLQQVIDSFKPGDAPKQVTVILVRQPGESLNELLDHVRVDQLRCPRNVPADEWLAYFKARLGDSGRRLNDII